MSSSLSSCEFPKEKEGTSAKAAREGQGVGQEGLALSAGASSFFSSAAAGAAPPAAAGAEAEAPPEGTEASLAEPSAMRLRGEGEGGGGGRERGEGGEGRERGREGSEARCRVSKDGPALRRGEDEGRRPTHVLTSLPSSSEISEARRSSSAVTSTEARTALTSSAEGEACRRVRGGAAGQLQVLRVVRQGGATIPGCSFPPSSERPTSLPRALRKASQLEPRSCRLDSLACNASQGVPFPAAQLHPPLQPSWSVGRPAARRESSSGRTFPPETRRR